MNRTAFLIHKSAAEYHAQAKQHLSSHALADYQLLQVLDPKFSYPTAAEDRIGRVQLKSIRWKPTGEIKQLPATVQVFESTICRSECEEVISVGYPEGTTRYYIPCPQDSRVEVNPVMLERWTINWDALA